MNEFRHRYPWQIMTRLAAPQLTCRLFPESKLDVEAIQSEAAKVISTFGTSSHSRNDHHDGGWNAIGLIAHDGNLHEDRLRLPLKPTPALELAPYIGRFIERFETEKLRVRLLELQPRKSIFWHYDRGESIDGNQSVRLHVPIITNDRVAMQLSHLDLAWRAGETWYGDFSFPHRLWNGGEHSRVHLVIDLKINDFVRALFPPEFLAQRPKRLQVKPACQRMVDVYEFGRLPRRQQLRKFARTVRKMAGVDPSRAKPRRPSRPESPLIDHSGSNRWG